MTNESMEGLQIDHASFDMRPFGRKLRMREIFDGIEKSTSS
jgi:hypothetical protein